MHAGIVAAVLGCTLVSAAGETGASFLAVPRVDAPPRIDGSIQLGEWRKTAVTCGFRDNGTGHPARAEVVVSACYDDTALYCLLECRGEDLEALKGGPGKRDSSIWSGSDVEVFLAPENWPQSRYAHFMINHADTIADEMCDGGDYDSSWNPDWQHAVGRTQTAWLAEVAIPWASLKMQRPQEGAVLRANFARNAASISELCTWAPVRGGFHHPEQFGTLVLAGEGPAAAIESLPGRKTGSVEVEARMIGPARGARLTAAIVSGHRARSGVYSAPFFEDQERQHQAKLPFDVPDGASHLQVSAHDATGGLIWGQTVELDLPALGMRVGELRSTLRGLRGSDEEIAPLLARLSSQLDELARRTAQPLDAEGVSAVEGAIEAVGRRVTDLALLARARQAAGYWSGDRAPSYFVTNPVCTRKIQPTTPDPGPLAVELRIAMAKGEYEPVQVVVCAVTRDLGRVRVSAGKLTGPAGRVIPVGRVVVTPVGSVHCKISTQGARLTGDVPDVLLPNRAMEVSAGRRQTFFVTVQTTSDDMPGEYRGNIWVRARDEPPVRLRLLVRVYDVTLPLKSHLRTAFVLWNSGVKAFTETTDTQSFMKAYIRYAKVMLAHRISPITMWRLAKTEEGTYDFSNFDQYLSALQPLGLTTLNIGGNGYLAKQRDTEGAAAMAGHLKERGWWDLHYVYGQDEAPRSAADTLRTNYSALLEAVPDLKIMQTGWSPSDQLKGLVRIWCPLTATADMEATRTAQRAGDEVWWYVCCGPIAPYANLFVDYPGIDHRILGWMTYQNGIGGFLYWGVNVWTHNRPPVEQYDDANYANWNPNSYSTINGDGYLLYPGKGGSTLASLRLALLRDGFEDYDLFTEVAALAAQRGGQGADHARRLLDLGPPLISSLREYTQDGSDLLSRREAILRVGERLAQAEQ